MIDPHAEALTANQIDSERCSNPFCHGPAMDAKPGKRFCCSHCRMDGYVLRRAKAMIEEVGIVEFHRILKAL
jgi:hypothetical protein